MSWISFMGNFTHKNYMSNIAHEIPTKVPVHLLSYINMYIYPCYFFYYYTRDSKVSSSNSGQDIQYNNIVSWVKT